MGRPKRLLVPNSGPIVIEDDDDVILIQQEKEERALASDLAEIIDLTGDLATSPTTTPQRPKGELLDSYQCRDGTLLKAGMTFQLKSSITTHLQAKFIQIRQIVRFPEDTRPVIRGWLYTRTRLVKNVSDKDLNEVSFVDNRLNEVSLVAKIDNKDLRYWEEQALYDVRLSELGRVRELRTTNAPFKSANPNIPSFRAGEIRFERPGQVEKHRALVCRYRFLQYFNGPEKARQNKPCQWALVRVLESDADKRWAVSDQELVNDWRGGRRFGGSHVPNEPPVGGDEALPLLVPGQQYSCGDVFAGAGGVSRGMTLAGGSVIFAVDNWDKAATSLDENFRFTNIHHENVDEFITSCSTEYRVDVLHLSPPCQVWSPAHTQPGKDDAANEAALFSCRDLVGKIRPRLFTLEQTFGILHNIHARFFHALIQGFTDHGYSVRWQVVNLANYGLPQPRRRLIIIGAGPGETLPDFPPPLHNKDGTDGLQPYVTVRQALAPLQRCRGQGENHTAPDFDTPKPRWDPDRPLVNAITTGGGKDNYHWSGTRPFTIAEFARLQGFPEEHKFVGTRTDKKRQIGNAFPPSVVKVLYKHLFKWLDWQDGVKGLRRPLPVPREGAVVVNLDPDPEPIDVDALEDDDVFAPPKRGGVKVVVREVVDSDVDIESRSETLRGSPSPSLEELEDVPAPDSAFAAVEFATTPSDSPVEYASRHNSPAVVIAPTPFHRSRATATAAAATTPR